MCSVVAGLLLLAVTETGDCENKTVTYRVIEQWMMTSIGDRKTGSIKLVGSGKVIVIDAALRNEEDLKKLGEQLKADTKADQVSMVFIFDDEKAAANRKDALAKNVSKEDLAHFEKHSIGSYSRTGSTGVSTLKIFLDGPNGKTVVVKF